MFLVGDEVRIRVGASVMQDLVVFPWPDLLSGTPFTIYCCNPLTRRYGLKADGYGSESYYGNGPVFVNEADVLPRFETRVDRPETGLDCSDSLWIDSSAYLLAGTDYMPD